MSARSFDVAGTGSMVVDEIHLAKRIVSADEKGLLRSDASGRVVQRQVGGVTLNHLGWARVLGLRTAIFGKQADDPNGRFLRAGMERLGIEPHIDLSGSASSFAQIYVDPDGARAIYMARGATGELTPEDVENKHRHVIESAAIVTTEVSQVPLATARRVLELARAAGALTVVDLDVPLGDAVPALGSEADLFAVLGLADVLKPSLVALDGLVAPGSARARARELAERTGAKLVALTLGAAGSLLLREGEVASAPAASVKVLDTTGAGDAFLGGLLAGLRYELDLESCARLGNACGAACCEQIGAFPEHAREVRRRVLELYAVLGGAELPLPPLGAERADSQRAVEQFLEVAARELSGFAARLDRAALAAAAELVLEAESSGARVHVTGVGKSEHVARYAASLLSSTGTPAFFLHGTEVTHGSVGQLRPGDVVIAISNSGTTEELLRGVEALRAFGARVLAVTARRDSPLGRASELVLEAGVAAEGDSLGLAPRTSVLAQTLALAALSVQLQEAKGFTREDYARRHPAGELGRKSREGF
ncbi:MAG TPA: PfkB family carbohydrate kinase [Myxococcota bacterium]|nr:PfkB family carbohydrate kinase [Myxococcota bacterium]